MDVFDHGGLDLKSWDGVMTWLALLMGFFFLLRSSEYLRKNSTPDENKCLKRSNITCAVGGGTTNAPDGVPCDEVVARIDTSKTDQVGQGSDNNIKRCTKDPRLCIPSWFNVLRVMSPGWLDSTDGEGYLLTMSDGRVLDKNVITRLLREAALRRGLDPKNLDTHSLRAGGCSAMHDAKLPEHVIQRRGRWVSNCWKLYCWQSRSRDDDLADAMAGSSSELFAHLH